MPVSNLVEFAQAIVEALANGQMTIWGGDAVTWANTYEIDAILVYRAATGRDSK